MRVQTKSFAPVSAVAVLAAATLFLGAPATKAAVINYGNFNATPGNVTFQNVSESSGTDPVPLYGAPAVFSVGLDFDPTSFVASSTNGANDLTDGQLNFTIAGNPAGAVAINAINISEGGDYTLFGTGTNITKALAAISIRATVLEINNSPVAPINLAPTNASVTFNLVANAGNLQPWSLAASLNIAGQLLGLGFPANAAATKVEVVLDNNLGAVSEANSISLIAKKDFRVEPLTVLRADVPEPTSLAALSSLALLPLARRRRTATV